jgi:catechol-2,3-dioxygenase
MPIDGFAHFNLRAPRELLDTLFAFYRDVVGLYAGYRPPFRSYGYWLYAGGKDILHLTESAPGESRSNNAVTTFDHVAFACSGRGEIEARLRANGIDFSTDHVPSTRQVQLFLQDPAGNGVELNFVEG